MKEKPTAKDELELLSIANNWEETVQIPHSKDSYKIGWIKEYTKERLSVLELESGLEAASSDTIQDAKKRARFLSKSASYIILNGFKAVLFHWLYWRYLYYIKGYSSDQLLAIVQVAKKKATQAEYYLSSALISHMKITNPTLTKKEAELIQSGLMSELGQPSEKNMDGR